MSKQFAILSDLHCHPSSGSPQYTYLFSDGFRKPANRHPIASLIELIDRERLSGTVDAVISPGDLTNQIDRQGLTSGWSYIKEIATKLKTNTIISTLGNHDIDSQKINIKISEDPFHLASHLGSDFPVDDSICRDEYWLKGYTIVRSNCVSYLRAPLKTPFNYVFKYNRYFEIFSCILNGFIHSLSCNGKLY